MRPVCVRADAIVRKGPRSGYSFAVCRSQEEARGSSQWARTIREGNEPDRTVRIKRTYGQPKDAGVHDLRRGTISGAGMVSGGGEPLGRQTEGSGVAGRTVQSTGYLCGLLRWTRGGTGGALDDDGEFG